jgi:hypothetical protein
MLEHPDDENQESEGALIFLPECPRHQTPAPARTTGDSRKDIKRLADFLEEGQKLESDFGGETIPTAQQLHDWGQRVLDYINSSEDLGEGYAARFNRADSQPGLEGIALEGRTEEEAQRWKWIRKRNAVLLEFIRDLQR